ncbi:glycoside hydrolase family 16 protein [Hypoxylon trugodes]|uniref:glycoside hydrolase family 16 protein n=1 Tax=Hypoxylon trugodes TaxID=326681 RepID=UPI00219B4E28|nr:glycoside hydrolase family 16 protein [Hypoxylon trugodes]KAI1393936.1 glycoside hydrolase family 16 protein [Hypoxylon trugodes]
MSTGYSLTQHYGGQGLLDSFSFFTGSDPTNGFVDYQSKENALAQNLVSVGSDYNNVILGVDSNNTYTTSDKGRPSVRLTSHDSFTHGLFIADIYHMPSSTCGTWPAFWAFNNQEGVEWPVGGELEIIEGANTAQRNLFSAHTTEGCQLQKNAAIGDQGHANCSPGPGNIGCNYATPQSDTTSYGDSFNAEGGGVYAMEWGSEDLKLWHFPRSAIPDNIVYGHVVGPNPSSWGPPQAIFGGSSCSPDEFFFNMSLVLNINFCGDYADNIWGKADQCNQLAPTCEEYVASNPDSFQGAYWDINFIDVYQYGPLTNMTIPPANTTTSSSASNPTAIPTAVVPTRTRTITLSTVQQTPTVSPRAAPGPVSGFTPLGCFGSKEDQSLFSPVSSSPDMSHENCVASCAGRKYAGVQNDTCYCADTLGNTTSVEDAKCGRVRPIQRHPVNSTLPVNVSTTATQPQPRAEATNFFLAIYADIAQEPAPPGAPAMAGGFPSIPAHNITKTKPVTVTYTTICETNPASLVEVEYTTTVTYEDCGCTKTHTKPPHPHPAIPTAVPMTTITEKCKACGPHGESTVILTVPIAAHTKTKHHTITAVAVQTVVPVINNGTVPAHGTAPVPPPYVPRPKPTGDHLIPISEGPGPASALRMLVTGLAMWFGVFVGMVVL